MNEDCVRKGTEETDETDPNLTLAMMCLVPRSTSQTAHKIIKNPPNCAVFINFAEFCYVHAVCNQFNPSTPQLDTTGTVSMMSRRQLELRRKVSRSIAPAGPIPEQQK